jgi:hypothetical protein
MERKIQLIEWHPLQSATRSARLINIRCIRKEQHLCWWFSIGCTRKDQHLKLNRAHMMTHHLHGSGNQGKSVGFTALGKTIGTPNSTEKDSDYVREHRVLRYFRKKLACYLHDYRRQWFDHLGLPEPNEKHDQLYESQV